jgi:exopolysaccharide biosynthesis protein
LVARVETRRHYFQRQIAIGNDTDQPLFLLTVDNRHGADILSFHRLGR